MARAGEADKKSRIYGRLGSLIKKGQPTAEQLDELADELLFGDRRPGRQPEQEYPCLSDRQLQRRVGPEELLGENADRVSRYAVGGGWHLLARE